MTATISETMTLFGLPTAGLAAPHDPVPVITHTVGRPAAQGDVLIRPVDTAPEGQPVPAEGVPVVEGNHTHRLLGDVAWTPNPQWDGTSDMVRGWATVTGTAYIAHDDEHGLSELSAGCYEVRSQADLRGRVAD